jgi:hypothetical protein
MSNAHLLEFIRHRGETVTVRCLMQPYAPPKNQRKETEGALSALSAKGRDEKSCSVR